MLAVVQPRGADHGDGMEDFGALGVGGDNFSDAFSGGGDLLHDIDLDDIFVGFDEADGLPDLEVEPNEIFGDISGDGSSSQDQSVTTSSMEMKGGDAEVTPGEATTTATTTTRTGKGELEDDGAIVTMETSSVVAGYADANGCKGTSAPPRSSQGKKKVKVDWTPDLHRRFVQAVEQLGIEKAVPSKILEIMGIEGLTRHNIASHLQKYRSHRKHVLAREAEAATWSQRRRMYGEGVGGRHGGGGSAVVSTGNVAKRVATAPWVAPTMGFPPPPPPAAAAAMHHFRPLHVWGHPTADHAMMHMWPRPMQVPSRPPLAAWTLPADPSSFWQHPHYPRAVPQVSPCLPPPPLLQPSRVTGIPPPQQPMYKQEPSLTVLAKQQQMELLPSNETIDAALGDVLSKPWLPLPLGLKPPSTDSVLSELQRLGISRVPPSCA